MSALDHYAPSVGLSVDVVWGPAHLAHLSTKSVEVGGPVARGIRTRQLPPQNAPQRRRTTPLTHAQVRRAALHLSRVLGMRHTIGGGAGVTGADVLDLLRVRKPDRGVHRDIPLLESLCWGVGQPLMAGLWLHFLPLRSGRVAVAPRHVVGKAASAGELGVFALIRHGGAVDLEVAHDEGSNQL